MFDPQLFGASESSGNLFDSAIFDSSLFDTGEDEQSPVAVDVIRNFRLKKDRKYSVDNWEEWVREEEPEVVEAVQAAVVAENKIQAGLNDEADIKANLERLEIAREAYRAAYKAAFTEEFKRQWLEDLARYRFEIKRRAALLLLLS